MKSLIERFNDYRERSPVGLYCVLFIVTLTCTVLGNYFQNELCKDLYAEFWGILITVVVVDQVLKKHEELKHEPIIAQKNLRLTLFREQAKMVMGQFINLDTNDPSPIDEILTMKNDQVHYLIAIPLQMIERSCHELVLLFADYLEPKEAEALLSVKLHIDQVSSTVDLIMVNPDKLFNDEEEFNLYKDLLKKTIVLLRDALQPFQSIESGF